MFSLIKTRPPSPIVVRVPDDNRGRGGGFNQTGVLLYILQAFLKGQWVFLCNHISLLQLWNSFDTWSKSNIYSKMSIPLLIIAPICTQHFIIVDYSQCFETFFIQWFINFSFYPSDWQRWSCAQTCHWIKERSVLFRQENGHVSTLLF